MSSEFPVVSAPEQAPAVQCDSMERLVPDAVHSGDVTGEETLKLHFARYEFASRFARPGRLLDISCGVGYGTSLLAGKNDDITQAVGVDIDESAIAYAQERYASGAIEFCVADALKFTANERFHTIVSLETIEHLDKPAQFIERMAAFLHTGGVLIGSVPTTPSIDANPHHKHDFTERSFRRLFGKHGLTEIACFRQVQRFQLMPLLTRKEPRAKDLRRNLPLYYLTHPASMWRRIWSTLRCGFTNHYITIAWQKA